MPIIPPPTQSQRLRKAWGWTTEVFHSDRWSAHFLEVEAGGFCSIHVHRNRANIFSVHSGELSVECWFGIHLEAVTLMAGSTYCVPSLVMHRFRCQQDVTCSEYYYADRGGVVDRDDIVRFSEGGKKP